MQIRPLFTSSESFCEKIIFCAAIPFMSLHIGVGFLIHKVVILSLRIFEHLSKDKPIFPFPKKREVKLDLGQSFQKIFQFEHEVNFRINRDVLKFNQDLLYSHLKSYMNLNRYKELYLFEGEHLLSKQEIKKLEAFLLETSLDSSICYFRSQSYKSHIFLSKILDALLQLKEKAKKNPRYSDFYKDLLKDVLSELVHRDCSDQTLVRAETILLQVSTELLNANNIPIILKSILSEYQKNLLLEITTTLYPKELHQADFFQEILKEFNKGFQNPVPSRNSGPIWPNLVTNVKRKTQHVLTTFQREYRPIEFLFEKLGNSYTPNPSIKKLFSLMGPWFKKTINGFDFENIDHAKALMPEAHRSDYKDGHDFFMHNGAFSRGAIAFFLYHNGILLI